MMKMWYSNQIDATIKKIELKKKKGWIGKCTNQEKQGYKTDSLDYMLD